MSTGKIQHSGRRWWTVTALLAVGCLGVSAWLVPTAAERWDDLAWEELFGGASELSLPEPSVIPAHVRRYDAEAPLPQPEAVRQALAAARPIGLHGTWGGQVVDVVTGQVLSADSADTAFIPASNLKVLTAFALLSHHQASDRFETAAYAVPAAESAESAAEVPTVVLRAGGDTLLSPGEGDPGAVLGHAGLRDLAEQAVKDLVEQGVSGAVPVALDESIFPGEPINPSWAPEDVAAGYVTGIHPIALWDHHTQRPAAGEEHEHRSQNAAAEAHAAFIDALNAAGQTAGISFEKAAGSPQLPEEDGQRASRKIGQVESATVLEQAHYMLENSDNVLAEVLGRMAAVAAGEEGTLAGARTTITHTLSRAGVSRDGLHLADLCGLSMQNRVTPQTLVQTLQASLGGISSRAAEAGAAEGSPGTESAAGGEADGGSSHAASHGAGMIRSLGDPALLASALPVAGGSGTLIERFEDPEESAAVGFARAKTGTLLSVSSLTGITQTSQGRLLAYAFVLNDVEDTAAARDALDRAVAALSTL